MTDSLSHLRRDCFDEIAALYDRARPAYPAALVDDLVRHTGLGPGSRVLEIGCGNGLMTVPIAGRGARILALELGANLAAVARRRLARFDGIEVEVGDFDHWTLPSSPFELVIVATAFHWLRPETRLTKCAAALAPGGVLALVETHWGVGPKGDRFSREVQACFERWDPDHARHFVPPTLDQLPQTHRELARSELFTEVTLERHCIERRYAAREYRDLIDTWSSVRVLDPLTREGLLDSIAELVETRFAGALRRHDTYSLWLARKRAVSP